jgi:hypothetical protein
MLSAITKRSVGNLISAQPRQSWKRQADAVVVEEERPSRSTKTSGLPGRSNQPAKSSELGRADYPRVVSEREHITCVVFASHASDF